MLVIFQEIFRSISRNKGKWFIGLKLVVTVWLVSSLTSKVGGINLFEVIKAANYFILTTVILLMVANIYLQYSKWAMLAGEVLKSEKVDELRKAFFIGILFSSFTPGRLGEYLGRKLAMKEEGLLEITLVTFLDKIFNLFFVAGFGALSLTVYLYVTIDVPALAAIALFVSISLMVFVFMHILLSEFWWKNALVKYVARFKFLAKYRERFLMLKELDRSLINRLMFFSMLIYAIILVQYGLLVMAFSGGSRIFEYIWAGSLFFYTKSFIPAFTWGELGVREAVSIFYLTSFGLSEAVGFNSSLFLFLINIFLPSIPGIWFLLRNK